ncbi:hypothetical protein HDV00_007281 [Rhizophlyctis rosea]|nr:hypothetical protein HDV00_007281 [Rhizophlyctis rosea]
MTYHIESHEQFTTTLATNGVVIVDYTACWCPPCKFIAPHYENLANVHPEIPFLKVDVDENPDVAEEAGATAMPTFVAYKAGLEVGPVVGANLAKLKALVEGAITA